MTTADLAAPMAPDDAGRSQRRLWSVITALLMAALFTEAAFAGAMLSGFGWARGAHSLTAAILAASTGAAGLTAVVRLRRIRLGRALGWTLVALSGAIVLQTAVGVMTAKGHNLLWVHVPLGVALIGLAGQAAACARRLGLAPGA
jgi:hypothetical protein